MNCGIFWAFKLLTFEDVQSRLFKKSLIISFLKKFEKFKSVDHKMKKFDTLYDVLQSSSNICPIWHHFQPVFQFSSSWQVHKSCLEVSLLASFWSGTHWYLSLGGVWMWNFEHVKFDLVVCLSETKRSLEINLAWYGQGWL